MSTGGPRRYSRPLHAARPHDALASGMAPRASILLAAAALAGSAVGARAMGVVTVNQPWVRPAGLHASTPAFAVFGSSEATTIVGVRSPLGDVALMRGKERVDGIPVQAGVPIEMSAHGPHLLLRGLTRPLAVGQRVPLTVVLQDAAGTTRQIDVDAEVRLRSPIDDERRAHGKH